MAWTQTDADNLKAAIAKGERSVSFADRTVTYRSVSEMREALSMIEAELGRNASPPRPKTFLGYAKKGF
jgi:hypothetical protein